MEIWKDVVGYERYYKVSNIGKVKSCTRMTRGYVPNGTSVLRKHKGKILKNKLYSLKYYRVTLMINGISDRFLVHTLVMAAFVGKKQCGFQINHKDGNKTNNHLSNLEYVTPSQNMRHAIKNKLIVHHSGESHYKTRLCNQDIFDIREYFHKDHDKPIMERCKELSNKYSICKEQILKIIRKKSWSHI